MGAKKTFERLLKKISANRAKMERNRVQGYVKGIYEQKIIISTPTEAVIVQNVVKKCVFGQKNGVFSKM